MAALRSIAPVVEARVLKLLENKALGASNILGLDISSKAIGVGVTNLHGEMVHTEVITATSDDHIFEIAGAVSERIAELNSDYKFMHIAVEDVMKSFAVGRFHTQGLFKLARLNGIISFECWRRTECSVGIYMPNAIRSYFDIKKCAHGPSPAEIVKQLQATCPSLKVGDQLNDITALSSSKPKDGDDSVKLAGLTYLSRIYGPDFVETWDFARTGSLKPTVFDRSDALLISMFGAAKMIEKAVVDDADLMSNVVKALEASARYKIADPTHFQLLHAARNIEDAKEMAHNIPEFDSRVSELRGKEKASVFSEANVQAYEYIREAVETTIAAFLSDAERSPLYKAKFQLR